MATPLYNRVTILGNTCRDRLLESGRAIETQQYWAVREYLSPVLKESKFKEHGRITPEEFVAAGDFLAYKFPVWTWETGDSSKARDYLPADKQYLLMPGVACLRRASTLAYTDADEDAERLLSFADPKDAGGGAGSKEEEWVETHAGRSGAGDAGGHVGTIDDIPDVDDADGEVAGAIGGLNLGGGGAPAEIPDMDEIPDMEEDLEGEDEATAAPKPSSSGNVITADEVEVAKGNLLQVRTYDVMITYDKYYQTPRIWLIGYDEKGIPLTPSQIFQDVSADHAFKTVTIEPFPHSASLQAASVHPCKHASVMKKVIERMNQSIEEQQAARRGGIGKDAKPRKWLFRRASGNGKDDKAAPVGEEEVEGMRVDLYLVVFLKFIASIVPTIEVDSTASF
ncbi:autophagocytosis associated protein [Ganoderma leucocontextum]|nr:autophagocytosis associated protein [Ganoderma leucocontextum]